jgi:hypothetical protein
MVARLSRAGVLALLAPGAAVLGLDALALLALASLDCSRWVLFVVFMRRL